MPQPKEVSIDLLDLDSDWLDRDREQRLAKRRDTIRARHRRNWLRRQHLQRRVGNGEEGQEISEEQEASQET